MLFLVASLATAAQCPDFSDAPDAHKVLIRNIRRFDRARQASLNLWSAVESLPCMNLTTSNSCDWSDMYDTGGSWDYVCPGWNDYQETTSSQWAPSCTQGVDGFDVSGSASDTYVNEAYSYNEMRDSLQDNSTFTWNNLQVVAPSTGALNPYGMIVTREETSNHYSDSQTDGVGSGLVESGELWYRNGSMFRYSLSESDGYTNGYNGLIENSYLALELDNCSFSYVTSTDNLDTYYNSYWYTSTFTLIGENHVVDGGYDLPNGTALPSGTVRISFDGGAWILASSQTWRPIGGVDVDADGWPETVDCNDTDATIYPWATELSDAIDQDCDGYV